MSGENLEKDIKVVGIRTAQNLGNLVAFVDVDLPNFVVRDFRVIARPGQGPVVRPPTFCYKSSNGAKTYRPMFEAKDDQLAEIIESAILEAWNRFSRCHKDSAHNEISTEQRTPKERDF
jgi:DNA-binding cell septation regulator SpoVG